MRLAHFNLALLAEQRGDVRQAEREYFEELKLHPDNFKAAFNLSRLYEQVGDREGQIGALKQSIESNPRFAEGHFFLAKAYLDPGGQPRRGRSTLARKGLELAPKSEYAPLGHYVLADIYNRQGRAGRRRRKWRAGGRWKRGSDAGQAGGELREMPGRGTGTGSRAPGGLRSAVLSCVQLRTSSGRRT